MRWSRQQSLCLPSVRSENAYKRLFGAREGAFEPAFEAAPFYGGGRAEGGRKRDRRRVEAAVLSGESGERGKQTSACVGLLGAPRARLRAWERVRLPVAAAARQTAATRAQQRRGASYGRESKLVK